MVNNGEAKAGTTYAKVPPRVEYASWSVGEVVRKDPDLLGWPVRWSRGGWQGDVC
jgi:hypothetical protein